MFQRRKSLFPLIPLILSILSSSSSLTLQAQDLIAPGAEVKKVAGGFQFTEGPATDKAGNVYFTDIPNNRIHIFTTNGQLRTFREDSNATNGLFFDARWRLHGCEGGAGRVTRMDGRGRPTVLTEKFGGATYNSPNDLWIDPEGGIYFTDPRYGDETNLPQDGFHVYYIPAGGGEVARVVDDLVKPNGIIGTSDGMRLYVADLGDQKTYAYEIESPGKLGEKKLFAPQGSDGVTLDESGNLYLTGRGVTVYSPTGEKIMEIAVPLAPANVAFGGVERDTLFMTARTALFAVKMNVKGMY